MFAELYLLTHFRSIIAGAALISAVMTGYGSLDDDLAFRVALHFGVHLVVVSLRLFRRASIPFFLSLEMIALISVGRTSIRGRDTI
jgi:hypothetical protein